MMKVTVAEARAAYTAIRNLNATAGLPVKAAWRTSRLLGKLKPVVKNFEETQLKLFTDRGGVRQGNGVVLEPPTRGEKESDESWAKRIDEHREKINGINDELRELDKEEIEIDYDALPLSMFQDPEGTPPEKMRQYNGNDFADAGPFIVET